MSNCYWCGNPCICRHLGEDMPQPERASANLSTIGNDYIVRWNASPALTPRPLNEPTDVPVITYDKIAAVKPWIETPPPGPTGAALDEWQRIVNERLSFTFDVTPPADSVGYQLRYTGNWIPEIKPELVDYSDMKRELEEAMDRVQKQQIEALRRYYERPTQGHAESKKFASLKRLWDQGVIGDPTDYDDDCDSDEEDDE